MLKADGHRIRIATHKAFDQFVTEAGMEFFDIGGNPQDLMSYMVKSEFIVLEIFSPLPPKEKEWWLIARRPWTGPGNGVYLERRHKAKAGDARRGAASIEENFREEYDDADACCPKDDTRLLGCLHDAERAR